MKKAKKTYLGVVIINYLTYDQLVKAIESIRKSNISSAVHVTTVIVDIQSHKSRLQTLRKNYPDIIFLPRRDNIGCGAGFNEGIHFFLQKNAPDFLFFLTADAWVEKNTLAELLKEIQQDERIGIITPKVLLTTKPPRIYFVGGVIDPIHFSGGHADYQKIDDSSLKSIISVEYANMTAALVRTKAIEEVGLFSNDYFLYYEDTDLSLRLRSKGYKLLVDKNCKAWHNESSAVKKINLALKDYYMARNRLLFLRKYASFPRRVLAYMLTLKELCYLIGMSLIHPAMRKAFNYHIAGIVDGYFNRKGKKIFSR